MTTFNPEYTFMYTRGAAEPDRDIQDGVLVTARKKSVRFSVIFLKILRKNGAKKAEIDNL